LRARATSALLLVLAAAAAPVPAAPRAGAPDAGAGPAQPPAAPTPMAEAEAPDRDPDRVTFRFAWPAPLDAQVRHRVTRTRSGAAAATTVARYALRARRAPEEGLRLETAGTAWEGDLPFPPALSHIAAAASDRVVQRVAADGEFEGLENAEALRPVLEEAYRASVPPEALERAVAAALAFLDADAEERWNRAVGFWIGAELTLGQPYVMRSEARLPLVPEVTAEAKVEFQVRRRVPCGAAEREARCVEVTLRSAPDPAAVERRLDAVAARLSSTGAPVSAAALAGLTLESELVLVTDPETLLPHRVVWTESLRAAGLEAGPPLEIVERSEYDWRYGPAEPAAGTKPPARRPPRRKAKDAAPPGPSASR
jgi:hypothetical protein